MIQEPRTPDAGQHHSDAHETDAPPAEPDDEHTRQSGRRRARKVLWGSLAVAVVAAGGFGATALLQPADREPQAKLPAVGTVTVAAGDLTLETTARGKLQFASQVEVVATTSGVLTEIPVTGTQLGAGSVVYRVDEKPVFMLSGAMPAWRDFTAGMEPGVDIEQLERNLQSFGYLSVEPSQEFNWYTKWALHAWTDSVGLKPEQSLSKDQVLFSSQPLVVSKTEKQLGDRVAAGDTLFSATGSTKEVLALLGPAEAELSPVGTPVTIELPNGTSTTGKVTSVGAAEETKSEDPNATSELLLPVRVSLDDQAAASSLSLVSVKLSFGKVLREGVLTVPVDALVPVDQETFALELPRSSPKAEREFLPVEVGTFASGSVEVSGKGVREGLEVTVPKR